MSRLKYIPKRIAPRLVSKEKRENIGHGLPPEIKDGLRAIAKSENESVSWVLEKVIIEYFGLKKPLYVKRNPEKKSS